MHNPLKQYFRRPAIHFKLPSQGKFYTEGSIEMPETGEVPVFPMTAIDEITSKTPDALYNGSAIVDIIKSCVPAIKDPWQIPSIDIDPIMIAIRTATVGNEMEIESICPSCENDGKYGVNLLKLLTTLKSGNYEGTLDIGDLKIKFQPLSYKVLNQSNIVQFEIQAEINNLNNITDENERVKKSGPTLKRLTLATFDLMANGIASISTPNEVITNKEYILEYITNVDKATFETIRDFGIGLRQQSEIKPIDIKCVNCNHEYTQPISLNITDFFG